MAKARAIVKRRKAVRNIRKITQTMQLIATARFQKTMQRALASKPYTARIAQMIQTLAGGGEVPDQPLLRANPDAPATLLLIITSNRGLCGSYNAAVLRAAVEHRRQLLAAGRRPEIEMVGKKGANYFRFLGIPLAATSTDVEDRIAYERVAAMAERYMQRYAAGELGRVEVAFTRFLSVAAQRPEVLTLLPVEPPAATAAAPARPLATFEFSPPPAELLARLIPESVRAQLFQCFNDAIVSEQVARMVAMKAATDSAGEMIRYLTRDYNRARQSQITLELADIVGGAEAVK